MWRYLLAGLLVITAFLSVLALDDSTSWHAQPMTPSVPIATPAPAPAITPSAASVQPVPPMPTPISVAPRQAPVAPPRADPPIAPRADPLILTDLIAARQLIDAGQLADARNQLAQVQRRVMLRPVTPDQPNVAASVTDAIRALDRGDAALAAQTINLILASGF
jgi:hypothetical protein